MACGAVVGLRQGPGSGVSLLGRTRARGYPLRVPTAHDTSRSIEERMDAAYRQMSPAEKIARMAALTELAHSFALARIREQHPHESTREHRLRLCARSLSRDQMMAAFGWDPEQRP